MSIAQARYRILHDTHYRYASAVALSQQMLHLTPRTTHAQHCLSHSLTVSPQPDEWYERDDYFGNRIVQCALLAPHSELLVQADSVVCVQSHPPLVAPGDTGAWEAARERLREPDCPGLLDASQFLHQSPHVRIVPAAAAYAHTSFVADRPLLEAALDLTARIHADFEFDPEATTVATPVEEVLARRRGVCQDFAHLQLACLRALGLAARYVSGYLLTEPPPGQPRLIGADASHAWVSLFVPEAGWVDVDPTNDCMPDIQHITLAWGRDFSDVSPMRGVILGGGEHELEVRVTVAPLSADAPCPLPAVA